MFKAMVTLILILLFPILAAGQTQVVAYQVDPMVNIGDEVRIRLVGEPETWISGAVTGYDFMTLDLAIGGRPMSISMEQVAEIQFHQKVGNKAGIGAGIGAIIGGGTGLAYGMALANSGFFNLGSGEILSRMMAAAAGGALLGAVIGMTIPVMDWINVDLVQVNSGFALDGSQTVSLSFSF